jgi:hypothetical protein
MSNELIEFLGSKVVHIMRSSVACLLNMEFNSCACWSPAASAHALEHNQDRLIDFNGFPTSIAIHFLKAEVSSTSTRGAAWRGVKP